MSVADISGRTVTLSCSPRASGDGSGSNTYDDRYGWISQNLLYLSVSGFERFPFDVAWPWPGRQTEISRSDRGVWEDNRRPADRVACVIKRLATEFQSLQQLGVFRQIVALDVIEELTTASRHLQKAAARVEVLTMRAQMLGQVIDPGGEQRDLNLGRTGILIVSFVI